MKLLAKHDPQPSFPILKITFHLLNTIPGSACNILIALLLEKKEMNASALAFFQLGDSFFQNLVGVWFVRSLMIDYEIFTQATEIQLIAFL